MVGGPLRAPPHCLSEVGAGDRPSPIPLSPFPSSTTSSSSSVFPGAGPRFSFVVEGVDTWELRTCPTPGTQTLGGDRHSPLIFCGPYWGSTLGLQSRSLISVPELGSQGSQGLEAHGEGPSWLSAGSGGRFPKARGAPSPREPWLVSLAGGSGQVRSSGCALPGVSSQVRPNPQPPTGAPVFLGGMSGAGSLGPTGGEWRDSRVPAGLQGPGGLPAGGLHASLTPWRPAPSRHHLCPARGPATRGS